MIAKTGLAGAAMAAARHSPQKGLTWETPQMHAQSGRHDGLQHPEKQRKNTPQESCDAAGPRAAGAGQIAPAP